MESRAEQDGDQNVKGRTAAVAQTGKADGRVMFAQFGVFDDFLGTELAGQLLQYAIANEARFEPAKVVNANPIGLVDLEFRRCLQHDGQLGPLGKAFREIIKARLPEICAVTGINACQSSLLEVNMAAHRDGGFFKEHVDTLTGNTRQDGSSDRLISAVYYFNREPVRFSGGNLVILPLTGEAEPHLIAPRHDRLVVFPSFAPHAVQPVSVPGDAFADARFSINCWYLRPRS
ncbi:MAG: 2OG-Fe(II) oxygenase [Pontixanthobacter sp.]